MTQSCVTQSQMHSGARLAVITLVDTPLNEQTNHVCLLFIFEHNNDPLCIY